MRAVIQRVTKASVSFSNEQARSISKGLVVFVAIGREDSQKEAKWLADKIISLRIFANDAGKMDLSVLDLNYELLVISQFTLYGDCSHGKRPDFTQAAPATLAKELYNTFLLYLEKPGLNIVTGEFAADMLVEIHNDGPVTIIIDSKASTNEC